MSLNPIIVFIILIIVIAVAVSVIFILIKKLSKLKEKVSALKSEVDYAFNRRWIIIPKFIEEVKPHAKKNRENLERMILLRNTTYENMSFEKKCDTDKEFQKIINAIEKEYTYPDEMKEELTTIEERISRAKENFNASLADMNKKIDKYPYKLVKYFIKMEEEYHDL